MEREDILVHTAHFAPEGIAKATNKIDDSSRKISIRSLEVDDDRLIRLETIGKLLGIVKVARGNNMRLALVIGIVLTEPVDTSDTPVPIPSERSGMVSGWAGLVTTVTCSSGIDASPPC